MGADTFFDWVGIEEGQKLKDVFDMVVERAAYNYGHAGYTGTIAEKDSYVKCGEVVNDDGQKGFEEADKLANKLLDAQDERVDDKWGPAGVIEVKNTAGTLIGAVFFGWASS